MLRRDLLLADGTRGWLLISQPDHARLSRDLAAAWGADGFETLDPQGELLAAVEHHDDGWLERDATPAVDGASGRPRDFLETPFEEAVPIWEGSIQSARRFGPLAGYIVTRHFQALVERRELSPDESARFARSRLGPDGPWRAWLAERQGLDSATHTVPELAGDRHDVCRAARKGPDNTAERGLGVLQLFDWLSLWLAMAERSEPHTVQTPEGIAVTLTPLAAEELVVDPWPFRGPSLVVETTGRAVPAGRYESPEQVLAAWGPPRRLSWRLVPSLAALDVPRLLAETFLAHAEHLPVLASTNDLARTWAADAGLPLPALISADYQTAGRGRGANRWWTGRGSLAFSLLVDPARWRIAAGDGPLVSLAVAVALVETLASRVDDVGLHWPNDVFVGGRKIAGVLIERLTDGRLIVGVGLNVNNSLADAPAELHPLATTLRDQTGREHDRTELLVQLLQALDGTLGELGSSPGDLVQRADSVCQQHGQLLTLDTGREQVTGVCRGLDVDGAIVLETAGGPRRFLGGVLRHAL